MTERHRRYFTAVPPTRQYSTHVLVDMFLEPRHILDSEGYRWIAPLSAFYPGAVQPVDLSNWHPIYPLSRIKATAAVGNPCQLRPDYVALRPTSSNSAALEWALVEAKRT